MQASMPWRDFYQLTKPGIVRMVMITAGIGYVLASRGMGIDVLHLMISVIGIGLGAAGSTVLNNFLERDIDGLMDRTRQRALPMGRVTAEQALGLGVILTFLGLGLLWFTCEPVVPFTVLLSSFLYVVVYTPLKRRSWLNTSIGAIPGALPISCGWIAFSGHFDFGAWVLFCLMFAWQHPHFYAIAWIYKEDYRKAGFKMLSVVDHTGLRLFVQVILYAFLLLAVSLVPRVVGQAGAVYFWGALLLGFYFLFESLLFVKKHTNREARRLLFASIVYLPLLGLSVVLDVAAQAWL